MKCFFVYSFFPYSPNKIRVYKFFSLSKLRGEKGRMLFWGAGKGGWVNNIYIYNTHTHVVPALAALI